MMLNALHRVSRRPCAPSVHTRHAFFGGLELVILDDMEVYPADGPCSPLHIPQARVNF